ncbi:hypothetical protein ERO13_A05G390900v2 [Gossypium hirsutum]|uniref:Uncharacterized protein isoform X1 n=6 Tax=Gossypium TaxID=3633 RepID=A0A1U8PIL2_GOSHI|nr:uncharacterized protein LOC107959479 isoform X1 [Gossypium hirsutum]TYH20522.1 hypothetical protein ES288_A05G436800v1 [Gossypium darwinii]TYI31230.1 hypothetical protein ES332_A05G438900v1 [Gossypium tomentosum]TYJ38125.1 hypothetical protein E1A91_A05G422400v1 [Gossypium mustelinum]KAG4203261.1 hypothetical protein ERO13_A05G390900v2 [Gossypium hirsutum]TYI31235.1 hypothetical protein ES332_A05G438900v1 [Gossypium tomentosum]
MKSRDCIPLVTERKSCSSCLCSLIPATALLCIIYFLGSSYVAPANKEKMSMWGVTDFLQSSNKCKSQCKPLGSEPLPEGIITNTSNLQMRPLWGFPKKEKVSTSLFAVAVGIKQKDIVHKMVKKFLSSGFVVMLFHYDGIVDEWKDFAWSDQVIHVSARNQTKWWFAKRFLHPDIVWDYSYIFLWDEDLGVEDFHPKKYVSIVEREGLEISQPALDTAKSEVHHQITARGRKSIVHRRTFKHGANRTSCDGHSKAPPCTGWIEMMAPVFSRAAWRCVWYMIQNDLIHAWGLDMQLGYCAQGDRTKNIGVVDAEYIVHYNRPTLGGTVEKNHSTVEGGNKTYSHRRGKDPRVEVRRQSYIELDIFRKRWEKAVKNDKCWADPYQ